MQSVPPASRLCPPLLPPPPPLVSYSIHLSPMSSHAYWAWRSSFSLTWGRQPLWYFWQTTSIGILAPSWSQNCLSCSTSWLWQLYLSNSKSVSLCCYFFLTETLVHWFFSTLAQQWSSLKIEFKHLFTIFDIPLLHFCLKVFFPSG